MPKTPESEKKRYADYKSKRKKLMNENWERLRDDPIWWEEFLASVADKGRIKAHLTLFDIPYSSYYRWLSQNPVKKAEVAAALEAAGQSYAEQSADDMDQFDMSDPRFARLRQEQQRWFAARYNPEIYGERSKLEVEHSTKQADHLAALRELSSVRTLPNIKVINHENKDSDNGLENE